MMNRDTLAFIVYCAAVVAITLIHDTGLLALIFALVSLIAGKDWLRVASKALRAVVVFNAIVTVSYTAVSLVRGDFSPGYLVLVNIRVFLLTFLTALAARRLNLLRVFSFSRTMSYVITLALGQLVTFRRMLDDFRMAMTSRTIRRAGLRDMYRHAASSASFFFSRSMNDAAEITHGMKSRGVFDD
jgi:cobalt/nickel transport system permease protein